MKLSEAWWYTWPVPDALLLMLAISVAVALRAHLIRKRSFTAGRATGFAFVAALLSLPVLAVIWMVGFVAYPLPPAEFDSEVWKTQYEMRARMVEDLLESAPLESMTNEEVVELLGWGDASLRNESWRLYRPQDLYVLPPSLVVTYNDAGKVDEVFIEPGTLDSLWPVPSNRRIKLTRTR